VGMGIVFTGTGAGGDGVQFLSPLYLQTLSSLKV